MLLARVAVLTCVGVGVLPLLLLPSPSYGSVSSRLTLAVSLEILACVSDGVLLLLLLLLPSPSYGGVSGLLLSEGAGSGFYG